jgi:hypothetical protein
VLRVPHGTCLVKNRTLAEQLIYSESCVSTSEKLFSCEDSSVEAFYSWIILIAKGTYGVLFSEPPKQAENVCRGQGEESENLSKNEGRTCQEDPVAVITSKITLLSWRARRQHQHLCRAGL